MNSSAVDASWTLAPGPIALCALLGGAYMVRWRRVRRAGDARGAPALALVAFVAGVLVIAAALLSPLDRLAEQVFAMHMVQHLLLADVAPILLLAGLTKTLMRPLTRRLRALEEAAGPLATPAFAIAVYAGAMWLWHVPALYDAALEHAAVHVLEHVTFLSAGALYWWWLLSPIRSRDFRGMQPVIYMAATKIVVGMLGILLTFAPDPLYEVYERGGTVWGMTPSDDQAVAGAIMAVEQAIVMGIALAWLFIRALGESEREQLRRERFEDS